MANTLVTLLRTLFSQDVKANASTEVDIGAIELGTSVTVKWRGKPVFVRHRSEGEISQAEKVDVGSLKDPQVCQPRRTVLPHSTHTRCWWNAICGKHGRRCRTLTTFSLIPRRPMPNA